MIYLLLFLSYLKIGFFGFGGGYAMISLIYNEIVVQHGWLTAAEMADVAAISQMTPGPIAINCATYVGYKVRGMWGSAASTLGMVVPSFVIIFIISQFLDNFLEIGIIASAFRGIKVGVGIVIVNAGINMLKKIPAQRLPRLLLAFGLVAMLLVNFLSLNISSIALMLLAGFVSLTVFLVKGGKAE